MSRRSALVTEFLIIGPLRIIGIGLVALVIARVGRSVIRRGVLAARMRAPLRIRTPRSEQRARTIGEAIGSLWSAIVGALTVLMILQTIGVNLGPWWLALASQGWPLLLAPKR